MSNSIVSLNSRFKPPGVSYSDFPMTGASNILGFMDAKAKKTRDPDSVAIGKAIRRRRQQRGLKLAELAHEMDVSEGQMSKWENGENALTWPQIRKCARILKTTASVLSKDAEPPASAIAVELQELVRDMPSESQQALLAFLRGQEGDRA